jgi:DNA-binding transcriptional ArsR family regulator
MTTPAPRRASPVRIYNPATLGRADLIGQFVVRERVLGDLLRRVREADGTKLPQHQLIVGARGMGKTTLLTRLRYALEDDEALRARTVPLVFPEEQFGVKDLGTFWRNALDSLADALELRGRAEEVRTLEAEAAGLPESGPADVRAEQAFVLLERHATRTGAVFVLLVDNIGLVFDRIGEQAEWSLRKTLSSCRRIVLVAGSPSSLPETTEYGKAFYDYFALHLLEPLTLDESRALLLRLAERSESPTLRASIDADEARLRTLRLLTGGSPRALVVLFTILAQDESLELTEQIDRLLDSVTPYYKDLVESLPAQAQIVLDALAKRWDPTIAAELAQDTGLEVQVISSQLVRLERAGLVAKETVPGVARTAFTVAERLLNVWYLMRSSRRVRQRVEWLVRFLGLLYAPNQLRAHARRLLDAGGRELTVDHATLALALSRSVGDSRTYPLSRRLDDLGASVLARLAAANARADAGADAPTDDGVTELTLRRTIDRKVEIARIRRVLGDAPIQLADGVPSSSLTEPLLRFLGLSLDAKVALARAVVRDPAAHVELVRALIRHQSTRPPAPLDRAFRILERATSEGTLDPWDDLVRVDAHPLVAKSPTLRAVVRLIRLARPLGGTSAVAPREALRAMFELEHPGRLAAEWVWTIAIGPAPESALIDAIRGVEIADTRKWSRFAAGLIATRLPERFSPASRRQLKLLAFARTLELPDVDEVGELGRFMGAVAFADEFEAQAVAQTLREGTSKWLPHAPHWTLAAAHVERLELRSLPFARRLHEIALALAPSSDAARAGWAWNRFLSGDADAETLRRASASLVRPAALRTELVIGCLAEAAGVRADALGAARVFLADSDPDFTAREWPSLLRFCGLVCRRGGARDLGAVLDETRVAEKWRPLREAIRAAELGGREYLRRVAPEIREPAETIWDDAGFDGEPKPLETPGFWPASPIPDPGARSN